MTKAKSPVYVVKFRRRRSGRTNYRKRLNLVKSGKTRAVVRRSNRSILIQFINFDPVGDKTLVSFNSLLLKKLFNWPAKRNKYTAYLAGLYAGKQAKAKGVSEFVLDMGMHVPSKGAIVFAALKGLVDSGLKTSVGEDMLPSMEAPDDIKKSFEEAKKQISK
ncbi:MAG: 50S ribosomal protein L18 [Candidatus Micrarchaeota archaeon]